MKHRPGFINLFGLHSFLPLIATNSWWTRSHILLRCWSVPTTGSSETRSQAWHKARSSATLQFKRFGAGGLCDAIFLCSKLPSTARDAIGGVVCEADAFS